MYSFFRTDESWAGLILRVVLGGVIFAHGAQKLLGWFGGNGFGESIGSLALIAGLLTRFTAASFIVIMLGAIMTVHLPQGFFMNWFGQQQGEGIEFHLLVIAMSLVLLVVGGGKWSLDAVIARWLGEESPALKAREASFALRTF